jgi:hypothetical protein
MGVREYQTYDGTDVNLVTTAETVVCTIDGIATNQAGQRVVVAGEYNITLGASTTAVVTRIRRDSLVGVQVGEAQTEQISTAAGSSESHAIRREDGNVGEFSGRTYVMTVSQTAATANGTVNNEGLRVTVTP